MDDVQQQATGKSRFIGYTVISALLGSHAFELGSLIIAFGDLFTGDKIQTKFQIEAGLLMLVVSFVIIIIIESRLATKEASVEKAQEVVTIAIVGLVGGFFSILDKTSSCEGVPTAETLNALFYLVVIGFVFVAPLAANRWSSSTFHNVVAIYMTLALGAVWAVIPAGILQLIYYRIGYFCSSAECISQLKTSGLQVGSTSFYISSPTVAALFAMWSLIAVEPILNRHRWPNKSDRWTWIWLITFLGLIFMFIAVYTYFLYIPKHPKDGDWPMRVPDHLIVFSVFLLIQFSTISATILTLLIRRPVIGENFIMKQDTPFLVSSFLIVGICAYTATLLLPDGIMHSQYKVMFFVVAHATVAVITITAVLATTRRTLLKGKTQITA